MSSIKIATSESKVPTRMLVVRLSSLGDVVLTTGVLLYWHKAYGIRFIVMTKEEYTPIFAQNPAVDKIIRLTPEDMKQTRILTRFSHHRWGIPLVDLQGSLRTRLFRLVWKGKTYSYPKYGLTRRLFLLTRGLVGGKILRKYTVPQRYVRALPLPNKKMPTAEELRPQIPLHADEVAWAKANIRKVCPLVSITSSQPPIALHPFATHANKTWPPEYWLELAKMLEERMIPHFWIGQTAKNPFPDMYNSCINKTNLRQLIALLSRAGMLITGDSGPMHLALAVNTPVLALFGPTGREWGFYPTGDQNILMEPPKAKCRPCSLHGKNKCRLGDPCIKQITPAQVMKAIREDKRILK